MLTLYIEHSVEIPGDEQRDRSHVSIHFLNVLSPVSMRCALGSKTFRPVSPGSYGPAAAVSCDFPVTFTETRERRNARKPPMVTKDRGRQRCTRKMSGEMANLRWDAIARDASTFFSIPRVCNESAKGWKETAHFFSTSKRWRIIK